MSSENAVPKSGPPTTTIDPLRQKIDSLVNKKLHNDPAFQSVIDYVAPMIDELDIHTERKLRRQLEARQLEINREYLSEISNVNNYIQTFSEKIREMRDVCSGLTTKIHDNKQKTQDLLSKTSAIQQRKKFLETKAVAIDGFLSKYSLTEKEELALQGNPLDGTVTAEFFSSLQRVKQIYEESKQLLRTSGEHSAALEVMEEMSTKMEKAYEVLYRSTQRECRLLNNDFVELKSVVSQSFAALQDREMLFKYALDEFATSRKNHILRSYIDALTRGAGNSAKPIELLSHDPLRYVGDMLAWMYQAVESERDLLTMMLKQCRQELVSSCISDIVGQISSALCRPFKVRVEQCLAGESDPVTVYRISGLFSFYLSKMAPLVDDGSELCVTVRELTELTLNVFFAGLNSSVQYILGKMGAPDYDLLPVPAVHQLLSLLKDVLETHQGSLTTADGSKEQFKKIFECVLDPLHRAVQVAATQLASPLDVAVYTLNCLSAIQSLVFLYPYADERIEMLKAQIEANEDVLVSEEASSILANTALIAVYQKAASHTSAQGPMSALPGMDTATVSSALANLDRLLAQSGRYRLDQIARISSTRIRDSISQRTAENVVVAYKIIMLKVADSVNGYGQLADSFKSPEQVFDLLK